MNLHIDRLELVCRRGVEIIPFCGFDYFYGEIGAGKSTIARLIDYCFGGDLVVTPALQSEFIEVLIYVEIEGVRVVLNRAKDSSKVIATWGKDLETEQAVLPARKASGVVIPGTEVEVLSDFIFHIAGMRPPKVRRSRSKEDSDLERLSFRDLFVFNYLDQDNIDSSFFHLDRDAEYYRRLKSLNVLRFVLGYQQERVAELEVRLEEARQKRMQAEQGAIVLKQTLSEAGLATEAEIQDKIGRLKNEAKRIKAQLGEVRLSAMSSQKHAADSLRLKGQQLVSELEAIDDAIGQIEDNLSGDRRHLNEILALSTKIQRVTSARAILNGVNFDRCPRCTQHLPVRDPNVCPVCAQDEPLPEDVSLEIETTKRDFSARIGELRGIIDRQITQLKNVRGRRDVLTEQKMLVDLEFNQVLKTYDPSLLSNLVELERQLAERNQAERYFEKLRKFFVRAEELRVQAEKEAQNERSIKTALREARDAAEKDTENLRLLTRFFADCLTRSKLPGFAEDDIVEIKPPYYLPEVITAAGDVATIAFDTLGSGGVKTLFKACFAVAIHRLAAARKAKLPTLLIIDSPMKNISERENRKQFEGFHSMLYDIAQTELRAVQFILVDKEFCPPPQGFTRPLSQRHMRVDSEEFPPLIGYFRANPSRDVE